MIQQERKWLITAITAGLGVLFSYPDLGGVFLDAGLSALSLTNSTAIFSQNSPSQKKTDAEGGSAE